MRHRALRAISGVMVFAGLGLFTAGQTGPRATLAPLNPAYLRAIASAGTPLPSPQDISPLRKALPLVDETLPATFDLRQTYRVTPVRNQIPVVTCTFFAIFGSLESTLKPLETLDFSENHLDSSSEESSVLEANIGALARWSDPVLEEDDPWMSALPAGPLDPVKHLREVVFLPPRADALDNARIKQSVMNKGAVYAEMYFSPGLVNSTYSSYYNSSLESGLHAVAIIGWDDNFDKEKFSPQAPGDGAFLCKNSLGSNFGNAGYFHVSYYDAFLGRFSLPAVFLAEPAAGLTKNYQHDLVGCTARLGFGSDTAWFANRFVSVSTDPLAAVSFYSYGETGAYEIFVYKNGLPDAPRSGAPAAQFSGTLDTAGYKTVRLPAPVPMSINETFSVVVRLQTPENEFPVPIEHPLPGFDAIFQAAPGESFISADGNAWSDLVTYEGATYAQSNVCLKAFAGFTPIYPPAYLRADRLVNNLVFYKEYVDRLTWLPHPYNTEPVAGYRIYRKPQGAPNDAFEYLAQTGPTNLVYYVRGLQKEETFVYRVSAVTASGREGDPAEVIG